MQIAAEVLQTEIDADLMWFAVQDNARGTHQLSHDGCVAVKGSTCTTYGRHHFPSPLVEMKTVEQRAANSPGLGFAMTYQKLSVVIQIDDR